MEKWFQDKTEKTYVEKLRAEIFERQEAVRKKVEAHKYEMARIKMAEMQGAYKLHLEQAKMAQNAYNQQSIMDTGHTHSGLGCIGGISQGWGQATTGMGNSTGITTAVLPGVSPANWTQAVYTQYVNATPSPPPAVVMDPPFSLDELEAAQDFIDAIA